MRSKGIKCSRECSQMGCSHCMPRMRMLAWIIRANVRCRSRCQRLFARIAYQTNRNSDEKSTVPGQNGDKPKRRKSKRRHQNGDREVWSKRRQGRLLLVVHNLPLLFSSVTSLLNGRKQTSKKLCETRTTTPWQHETAACVDFYHATRGICRRRVSVCVSVTLRYCMNTAKHRWHK